jgi:uncharacterized protein YjiS (DUF1127 family)
MTTHIHNHSSLSKITDLLFARQTPYVSAEQHKGLLNSLKAWQTRRAAEAELNRLSDRDLADIGLTRQSIPAAVRVRSR